MQNKINEVQKKINGLEVIKEEQAEHYSGVQERYEKLV